MIGNEKAGLGAVICELQNTTKNNYSKKVIRLLGGFHHQNSRSMLSCHGDEGLVKATWTVQSLV